MEGGKIMSRPHSTKSNYRVRLFEGTSLAIYLMSGGQFFVVAGFLLLLMSGCSSVGGEVQAGRNALQTNRPEAAVAYLASAAQVDPTYRIPYRIPAGVLGYLGRAYLETGRPAEARPTLEKAVKIDSQDPSSRSIWESPGCRKKLKLALGVSMKLLNISHQITFLESFGIQPG